MNNYSLSIKQQSFTHSYNSVYFLESVSYVASPVVTPIWNAVGRPVAEVLWTIISNILLFLHYVLWTSSGRHIYSLGRTIVNSSWNMIQYFIMHFILVDTWILKK
jgi:hypothetical protein